MITFKEEILPRIKLYVAGLGGRTRNQNISIFVKTQLKTLELSLFFYEYILLEWEINSMKIKLLNQLMDLLED